jgi:hypothetical protein
VNPLDPGGGARRGVRRHELAFAATLALLFGAAPTVGDIGACGEQATPLDEATFAAQRKELDCQRCTQCGLATQTCDAACDPSKLSDVGWPATCFPLARDGVVCIDALEAASCSDYASFVSDVAPTVPTECDFCRDIPEGGVIVGDL